MLNFKLRTLHFATGGIELPPANVERYFVHSQILSAGHGGMNDLGIGFRQATRLCQMKHDDRLSLLAEGLPIILDSARGFWAASQQLDTMPREADVLENLAEEEAAKILIVMDIVRCPRKLSASKIGTMIKWFYEHLARIIYAKAASWKPTHITQLREYVDNARQAHYLEGYCGEYILPNSEIANREGKLYADIVANEDGQLCWNAPQGFVSGMRRYKPRALALAEALSALGLFTVRGLRLVADVWNSVEFKDTQGWTESNELHHSLVDAIISANLATEAAEQKHVNCVYDWQLPMYNIDFSLVPVSFDELQRQRERTLWAEFGGSGGY